MEGYIKQLLNESDINNGIAIALEAERLANKYGDFLSCEHLRDILGVGINNVRELMRSKTFPTIKIGNRSVVSTLSFVKWSYRAINKN